MATMLADVESVSARTSERMPSQHTPVPEVDSAEYRLFYLPAMVAVYTARHQHMPLSDWALYLHIFGVPGHAGCEACRRETAFLVAHQQKFL